MPNAETNLQPTDSCINELDTLRRVTCPFVGINGWEKLLLR